MDKNALILIGGGGHCKACIDVIEREGVFNIKGILDIKEKKGDFILGYPVIGSDEDIPFLIKKGFSFLITLGQIKSAKIRKKLYNQIVSLDGKMATVVSPTASKSKYSKIGEGSIVMHHATINAGAVIGVNCIINTASNLEHDIKIGNHCHVSTHSVINGNCELGNEVFVGSGSILNNGICVVNNVILGAGSLVYKNINESGIFTGYPLRKI